MGLTCSPRVFTRVSKFFCDWLRKRGVTIIIYIDDILVLGKSYKECKEHVNMVLRLLRTLGFLINEEKCMLEPDTFFTYLGCTWNTADWKVGLKQKRVVNIVKAAETLLAKYAVKVREVARFLGRVQSTSGIVPLARLRSRAILHEFSTFVNSSEDYNSSYIMSEQARDQLISWKKLQENVNMPISYIKMKVCTIDTDASDIGFGWYWNGSIFSEQLPEEWQGKHINLTELWTLSRFLETEGAELHDVNLIWRCDNNTALAAIKNEGSRSWGITVLATDILEKCQAANVVLQPVRVTSEQNILADAASRLKIPEDWSLSQRVFNMITKRYGNPDIDLMASQQSRKAPYFFSWNQADNEALRIDALAQDLNWSIWENPYIFPPFPLIALCLAKIRDQRVNRILMIVPYWPGKVWFSAFMQMALEVRRLPPCKDLVRDTTTGKPPPAMNLCQLVVAVLSGNQDRETFHNSLGNQESLLKHHGDQTPSQHIPLAGKGGQSGAGYREYRHIPLI